MFYFESECDFQCNDGTCVGASKWCDATDDCPDGEDEEDCCPVGDKATFSAACEEKGQFFCECGGSCIETAKVCDGVNNCCHTFHGIGSRNVTCAGYGPENLALDEQNCPGKIEFQSYVLQGVSVQKMF